MTEIPGIDYSKGGPPSSTAIKANGYRFVVRYVVRDLNPQGRGITAAEYADLVAGGVEVCAVWEGAENRIVDGYDAGVMDANDAQANLIAAGMPEKTPIYFACDFDAAPSDQPAIDAYLTGAGTVLGKDRVGIYGGYYVVTRCKQNRSARWLWQTRAWSRDANGNFLPVEGAHLLQYPTDADINGVTINGVACDANTAFAVNYGQASLAGKPSVPVPSVPWSPSDTGVQDLHGTKALAFFGETTAKRNVPVRVAADSKSKIIGTIGIGHRATVRGSVRTKSNRWIFVDLGEKGVGRALWSAFVERWPTL